MKRAGSCLRDPSVRSHRGQNVLTALRLMWRTACNAVNQCLACGGDTAETAVAMCEVAQGWN